jgi:O-antigen/teichoic acid export membrane protein
LRLSAAIIADRMLPANLAGMAKPWTERIDAMLADTSVNGDAQRMSMIAFAIRLVSAAIAFLSQILLARWIGDFQYGIFVLVWSMAVIVGNLSCFGFHTTIIRFVPEYFALEKHDDLRGLLWTGRLFAICSASVIAALGALGVYLFSNAIESYYVAPFYLGMLILPMIALGDTLDGTARANSWPIRALSPTYIIRPVMILAAMLLALRLGYEANAKTAILSAIIATYATTIFQLVSVTSRVDRKLPDGPKSIKLTHWFSVSLPIFLVEGFLYLLTNADVLVVGYFMDPQHVAVYFATVKILALVHFVYFAVKAGVSQRYAELIHTSDTGRLAAFARDSASWTFWPALFMACVVILLGKPLLSLFGPSFVEGYPLLFVLVAGVIARSSVGPAESLLNMSGNQNLCAALYAMTLCFSLTLAVVLIPQHGLWGAAIAVASGMAFEAVLLGAAVKRRLGFHVSIFAGRSRSDAGEA